MLEMKLSFFVLAALACAAASAGSKFDVCTKNCLGGGITPLTNERALIQAPCFVAVSSSRIDCYSYTSPTSGTCPFGDNSVDCAQAPVTTTTSAPTTTATPAPTTSSSISTQSPSSTTTAASNSTTNNTTPLGPQEEKSKWGNAPWFIAGGISLIAMGIVVIVLVRKSRRTDHDDDDDDAHVLHVEQRTKQLAHEPAFVATQAPVAYPYTPTGHQILDNRVKQNGSFHQQQLVSSPYGGARAANNESFVRPRLPSGPVDPPLRILTVDPPQDYRALEAERGSVTF